MNFRKKAEKIFFSFQKIIFVFLLIINSITLKEAAIYHSSHHRMCVNLSFEAILIAFSLGCKAIVLICQDLFSVISKQKSVKMAYILIMISSIFLIIFLTNLGAEYLSSVSSYIHCNVESGGGLNCLGVSAIYRTSFCLFILHLLIFLCCLLRDDNSRKINEELWVIKIFLFLIMLFFSFYIPNDFFEIYANLAKIIGLVFIVFQIIMMIDIFYLWGEKLAANYVENPLWGYWLLGTTIIFYTGTFLLNFYSFSWFTANSSLNSFMIILNLILILANSLLSISGIARNGSLLTSGGISLYETFILWTGLANSPKESNEFFQSHSPLNTEIFFGCLIIVISLAYMSFHQDYLGEKNESQDQNDLEKKADEQAPLKINDANININDVNVNNMDIIQEKLTKRIYSDSNIYVYFHIIMMVSSFFLAMLFTNWGAPDLTQQIVFSYNPNNLKYWIQIISSWTVMGIYIWTLVAPKILTNREFD